MAKVTMEVSICPGKTASTYHHDYTVTKCASRVYTVARVRWVVAAQTGFVCIALTFRGRQEELL